MAPHPRAGILSLFNDNLPEYVSNIVAQKIVSLPVDDLPIKEPTVTTIAPNSLIPDFIEPRFTVLFYILEIPHTFITDPDSERRQRPENMQVKTALMILLKLTPVNDSCERARALAT